MGWNTCYGDGGDGYAPSWGDFTDEERAAFEAQANCEHEWEVTDDGGGGSEFQPPDPAVRKCCLCGKREATG